MEMQIKPDQKKKIRHFGFSGKLYIFIICFLISSLIWVLIKLSRDYTEILKCRVTYINVPSDKVVVNDLDSVFTLKLKSKGFKLFTNNIFFNPTNINIDVASLVRKKKNSVRDYFIATSDLYQTIGTQIHYPNNVISIIPDTLYFRLEKIYNKKVPVKVKLNLSFAQQYRLNDSIKCKPDSVLVSGTKVAIDTIKFVETISKALSNLNSNQEISLDFNSKYSLSKIKISPVSVKTIIPVEKYTEATIDLPIIIANNNNNYVVRTFPEKVRVTYLVSLSNFKKVKPDMFSAMADISKVLLAKSKKMKVDVSKYPAFVEIRHVDPEKVEFLILK